MAIITNEQAEKFSSSSNSSWFQLRDDGDIARVQFLHDTFEDIHPITVHKVPVGDRERVIDCLRNPGDPKEVCPLCAADYSLRVVRYVIMYQHPDDGNEGGIKIWERGKQFMTLLQGFFNRYPEDFKHKVFEIQRNGKRNDKKTQYTMYLCDRVDPYDVSDIELPQIIGKIVLQKSYEDLAYYVEHLEFPDTEGSKETVLPQRPVRRVAVEPRVSSTPEVRPRAAAPTRTQPAPTQSTPAQSPRTPRPVPGRTASPRTSSDTEIF